ncbi:replication initiation protein RepM [Acinetobacter johnsonii]|uniref:replication initiation protein RepM n=1 Tax=Acinetobacter johnsonii TaxID=40214 RepID=UPI00280E0818|nr:replication initiation protein RepM [Acinetobacter johnsonii]MDQ8975891.1 replication initiation protein RepM [Acinetobacter johnsonii]
MSKETRLVVKDNALIDASFNLSLVEQRLMLLAIVEAREIQDLTPDTPIEIKASSYREQYNTDSSEAYKQLSEATKQLFNRQFSYIDKYKGDDAITVSRWLNEATYINNKGTVVIYLNRNVISMISRLEANFTKYLLEQVSDFKSQYSIRLYELLIKYKEVGNSKKYTIEEIRSLLGIGVNEYKVLADFKKRVLDLAVKEINDKTDTTIKYEQFKEGRTISHILFKIGKKLAKKKKDSKDQNTVDMFTGLSIKQCLMFGDKLSRDIAFQNHYKANVGENIEDYAERIATMLSDAFYVTEWMPYLETVGYINHKKE